MLRQRPPQQQQQQQQQQKQQLQNQQQEEVEGEVQQRTMYRPIRQQQQQQYQQTYHSPKLPPEHLLLSIRTRRNIPILRMLQLVVVFVILVLGYHPIFVRSSISSSSTTCSLCYNNQYAYIDFPTKVLTIPSNVLNQSIVVPILPNKRVIQITCDILNNYMMNGTISSQYCTVVQQNFSSVCGCFTTDSSSLLNNNNQGICYPCNNDTTATMLYPKTIPIALNPNLLGNGGNGDSNFQCNDILNGQVQYECYNELYYPLWMECGCTNFPTVILPLQTFDPPQQLPQLYKCNICSSPNVIVQQSKKIIATNTIFSGKKGITQLSCGMLYYLGQNGYINTTTNECTAAQHVAVRDCGCAISQSPTTSIAPSPSDNTNTNTTNLFQPTQPAVAPAPPTVPSQPSPSSTTTTTIAATTTTTDYYTTCYICYNNSMATMKYSTRKINYLQNLVGISQSSVLATCSNLHQAGTYGYLFHSECTTLLNYTGTTKGLVGQRRKRRKQKPPSIQSYCGCSNAPKLRYCGCAHTDNPMSCYLSCFLGGG